jgi:hypothetical protein
MLIFILGDNHATQFDITRVAQESLHAHRTFGRHRNYRNTCVYPVSRIRASAGKRAARQLFQ